MIGRSAGAMQRGFARLGSMGKSGRRNAQGWQNLSGVSGPNRQVADAYQASISSGRKRAAWGGAGMVGLGMTNSSRAPRGRSSGSTGMNPHSSGGATML